MINKDKKYKCLIVTPVYNDWDSFQCLVNELSKISINSIFKIARIIAVNDGSTEVLDIKSFSTKLPLTVINLSSNLGHQRAISIGLSYIEETVSDFDAVIVMDSDGEDRPIDIIKLFEKLHKEKSKKIIFAKREKRSEGFVFKFFYNLYKFIFYYLTKQKLDFGNFSCIPSNLLSRTVSISEIWNHYSGGIIKSKILYVSVGTDRGERYHGKSKMNFQNLILHGLSSISIYLDVVSVRLLFLAFYIMGLMLIGLISIISTNYFTDIVLPEWSSLVILSIINVFSVVILTTFLILLFQLNQKNSVKYPPKKFYKDFVFSINELDE